MSSYSPSSESSPGFPRYFHICGRWVNSYKVCLCIGIYVGILVSALVAEASGIRPLRMGTAALVCAVAGLAGARLYHLLVFAPLYFRGPTWRAVWDSRRGGWS